MTPSLTDSVVLVGFDPVSQSRVREALGACGCPHAESLPARPDAVEARLDARPAPDVLLLADRDADGDGDGDGDGDRQAVLALVVARRDRGAWSPTVVVIGATGDAGAAPGWIGAGAHGWLDLAAASGPSLAGGVAAARALAAVDAGRRRTERELRRVHESLSLAQRAGRAGLFDWRLGEGGAGGELFLSAEYRELIGLDPATPVTLADWLARVHPDDRAATADRVAALLADGNGSGASAEFRIRGPRDAERWLHATTRVERDGAGRALRLYGIAIDVTERRRRERDLRWREAVGARMAAATDPDALLCRTLADLADHLGAETCTFATVDGADLVVGPVHPRSRADLAGRRALSEVVSHAAAARLGAGEPVRAADPVATTLLLPARAAGALAGLVSVVAPPGAAWDDEAVALAGDVTARLHAVVDRLRATQALVRSERMHRRLAEVGLFGVGIADGRGRVHYVNDELLRMVGRTREDFEAGRIDWLGTIAPECLDTARREARRLAETGASPGYEGAFVRPDGSRTPYLAAAALVHPGEDLHVSIALDLTRVRAAEARARAAAEQLHLALQGAGAGAWSWDIDTGRLTWSQEMFGLYGLDAAVGVPAHADWAARVHPDDLPRLQALLEDARTRRSDVVRVEFRIRPVPGIERWVLSVGRLSYDADGRARHLAGIDVDITERQRAVQAERESTRLLRAVLETTTDLVWTKDTEGRITLANAAAVALLGGGDASAVIGRDPVALFPDPAQAAVVLANDRRILATGRTETVDEAYGAPQDLRVFQSVKTPLRDEDGRVVGLVGVSRDITNDRRAERALAEAHRRLEESFALLDTLFDGAPIGLAFLDTDYRYVRINRTLAALNDLPVEAHIGRDPQDLIPEIWAAVRPHVDRVRDSGEAVAGVLVRAPVPSRAEIGLGWWLAGYFPVRVRGELFGYGITAIDVTDQKRAEDALRAADARKDDFIATLAHELRNPLAPIVHAAGVLKASAAREPALRPLVDVVERQAVHMSHLLDDLLDVSRVSRDRIELRLQRLDLRTAVDTAIEASRPWLDRAGHVLRVDLPGDALPVDGDGVRLAQVLSNLLTNAAKYTPRGGHVTLTARAEAGDAVVEVSDDGVGIAPADLERVFEMFSQVGDPTATSPGGLGIGLWLVRRLVALHGGCVEAHSDGRGRGSRFTVRLPLAAPQDARAPAPRPLGGASPPAAAEPAADPGALTVLVVDDNADAAQMLALLLSLDGHRVAVAGDGPSALAAADADPPDVVLLDIGLPGDDGHAVCRAMRARPWGGRARIVAVTGWGQAVDRSRSREAGFDEHLTKPVGAECLQRALRRRETASPTRALGRD